MRRRSPLLLALLLGAAATASQSQEWPQWRGPQRNGQLAANVLPERWPQTIEKAWSVEVGVGHSSPLATGDRAYVFTRVEDQETVSALALESGEVIWRRSYLAPYKMSSAARSHGPGPKSTPVLSDGRLFTLGISGILSSFDAATGKLLWRREFSDRFDKTSPLYGTAMSPLVHHGRLIAHVGGNDDGALIAFDAVTGEELWSWSGDGPGYASPVVGELDGVPQIISFAQEHLVAIALDTGKLLWSLPFETPWVQNCVTPLVHKGLIIYSGVEQGTTAIRPRLVDGRWSVERVWHNDEASMYMSSPVPAAGRVCGFSNLNKGQYFCLDPSTGEVLWTSQGRGGENAALLAAGSWLLALSDRTELVVFSAEAESYAPVARYEMASSPTWAHPVVLRHGILIKDRSHLTLYRIPASGT
jgi:outer membrane protein assembly factor BamB